MPVSGASSEKGGAEIVWQNGCMESIERGGGEDIL